jgi:hypothetical protein
LDKIAGPEKIIAVDRWSQKTVPSDEQADGRETSHRLIREPAMVTVAIQSLTALVTTLEF